MIEQTVRLCERPGWAMQPRSRRLGTARIADSLFLRLFLPGTTYRVDGDPFPDDVRLVGVEYDILFGGFRLYLESETFDEVPEGVMPPRITPPSIHVTVDARPEGGD